MTEEYRLNQSEAFIWSGQKDSKETKKRDCLVWTFSHSRTGWLEIRKENNITLCKVTLGHSQVYEGLFCSGLCRWGRVYSHWTSDHLLTSWNLYTTWEEVLPESSQLPGPKCFHQAHCQVDHSTFLGFLQKVWHERTSNLLTVYRILGFGLAYNSNMINDRLSMESYRGQVIYRDVMRQNLVV